MTKIFFYGLFMDRTLLEEKGLHPELIGPAVLPGYRNTMLRSQRTEPPTGCRRVLSRSGEHPSSVRSDATGVC